MGFEQLLRDRQAHATAIIFSRKQRLENTAGDFRRDAGTVVGEEHLAVIFQFLNADPDARIGHALEPVDRVGGEDLKQSMKILGAHFGAHDGGGGAVDLDLCSVRLQNRFAQLTEVFQFGGNVSGPTPVGPT